MCKALGDNIFECHSICTGNVWGSGLYTSDSNPYAAARHLGLLPGKFKKINLPGFDKYMGSTLNGVKTYDYGSFGGSFVLVKEDGK